MSIEELVALTGLTPESARQAAAREYGEPLHWLVDEPERAAFLQRIQSAGAVVLQGGRFAHISGQSDKGHALRWLHSLYTGGSPNAPVSIAAGDSHNDVAMLEAADWSLRVRSPVQEPPELQKTWQVVTSEQQGPAGWAQGIADILARLQE
jgi:mannosyl-3-phosphoglycerate phosphatase